jgi:hypothetical protein
MSVTSKRREGFALAVSMVAIVVIGALIAGAFFTSTQEYRVGRNSLMDQRAFAAAEAGVTQPIQGWLKQLNLSMNNGVTANPDTLKITGGSYAVRRITRLDDYTFWVTSDGYAGPAGTLASHHKVNAIYRLAYPKFNILVPSPCADRSKCRVARGWTAAMRSRRRGARPESVRRRWAVLPAWRRRTRRSSAAATVPKKKARAAESTASREPSRKIRRRVI